MISLRLELLGGAFHAANHSLHSPEWPPHPDRVYQALTATLHELGNQAAHRAALLAIEGASWSITASSATDRPGLVHYVPRNEDQGGGEGSYNPALSTSRAKERYLPVCEPDESVVYFHIDVQSDTQALDSLARGVARLGRSPVAMAVASAAPPPNWKPDADPGAELILRVPYAGRLADLESAFESRVRAGIQWCRYRRCDAPSTTTEDRGEFSTLLILAASGRGVDGLRTAPLMDAARRAVLSKCPDPLPDWVSGHSSDGSRLRASHLGIVPTVFSGEHGDGRIMGLGLAIPRHIDQAEARRTLHALLGDGIHLAGQHWLPENIRGRTTEADTWTRPATTWTTVTPMEIRRRDRRPAVEIAEEWATRAGLPKPAGARFRAEPFVAGGFHAASYAPGKRPRFRIHALMEWSVPISGPVVLGMGRYRGFGLLRPL
ncbi:MAG TPA: type I-U CRISPR-associated protein Csb2 [Pirellulales bacterium]|nr:type I-U CRISPR-associated protein Csb2 [Pirellulales bacterium]